MRTPTLPLAALLMALPVPALHWLGSPPPVPATQDTAARRDQEPRAGGKQEEEKKKPDERGEEADPKARDIFGRLPEGTERRTPRDRIQGCWQLLSLSVNGFPDQGRTTNGVMLIDESFVAFELHMTWGEGQDSLDVHQSFIAEYELATDGRMRVNTVIGSFLDDVSEDLEWERPGFAREYRVSQSDRLLTLEFGQGDRMTFARRRSQLDRQSRDIYGRLRKETTEERDIFGRPLRRTASPAEGKR